MTETYDDGTLVCGPDRLEIHSYYFPFGTKSVPYTQIKGLQRFEIKGVWSGKWRIWGTGNPRYWANLDTKRPKKNAGLDARSVPSSPPTCPTSSSPCSAAERASERATPVR
jgi:hypothetical protein